MKVLQVGNIDTFGDRFNGAILSGQLRKIGIFSEYCTWIKKTTNPNFWKLNNSKGRDIINNIITSIEKTFSIQSLLYHNSLSLILNKRYISSDILHYHLVHNGFFSILTLPFLTRSKPSVWTIHDMWAFTGHCLYSFDCNKWKSGCDNCPYLNQRLEMKTDRTAFMWKVKKYIYKRSKLNLVVASQWMKERISISPLLSHLPVSVIPFGIDLNIFKPKNNSNLRKSYNIPLDHLVIGFRSTNSPYKGLSDIKKALRQIKERGKITLITFDQIGLVKDLNKSYNVIDSGWVDDQIELSNLYNMCDMFLMPSKAEAFGMMAIEAMACGKPVIVYEGTSLPEIIKRNKGGVCIAAGDFKGLAHAIEALQKNVKMRLKLGISARKTAVANYSEDQYIQRLSDLYKNILGKHD